MYTLEQLQQKNLKELKEIGWQLNVVPEGDRRCRQNWIDALIGVQPPLLQLLEDSPGVEPVQEAIEIQRQEPLLESSPSALVCPFCNAAHALYTTRDCLDKPIIRCLHCNYCRIKHYPGPILLEAQEPPIHRPETKDGIDLQDFTVQVQEPPIESKFGRIVYPKASIKPIAQNAETKPQLDRTESADVHNWRSHPAESVRDSSGAKAEALGSEEGDRVLALAGNSEAVRGGVLSHQPTELAATFNDEQPPNRGEGKGRIEPKVSQSAIVPAAKNHLDIEKVDPNPILTGVTFSERFLARYSPPQPESIRFHADSEGQLNLLDFEVPVVDEPPDPNDFESLDAFREAIALWDAEHPEPLEISLDSFCEWAPCPDDWYEPEPSEVSEHSPAPESSITCNFSIPTFDAWCDRAARQIDTDEPPDTGNFAKLPGPKPPKFPPGAIGSDTAKKSLNANRHYTQPNRSQAHITHIAAGSSSQSGRSPPGGDAMH
ncbi:MULTISPECIES: hypothetical protein [unclassified Microcoleus]|uniref:hypothetical protein n=1 Tax=unclassified Microcoleus TaxID=2642155 RepID=UPI002FD71D50